MSDNRDNLDSDQKELSKTNSSDNLEKKSKGEILKNTRKERGLSLDIIHEETKIPMDVLRAIEEGYKVRTISPFYLKGFLKIYANYLDVDINNVIEDYKKEELPKHIKYTEPGINISKKISEVFTRKRKQQIVLVVGGLIALFLVFKILMFVVHGLGPKEGVKKVAVRNVVKATQKKTQEKKSSQPVVKLSTKKLSSKKVQKKINLAVKAKRDSFLLVKEDGKEVSRSVLRAGAVEMWSANEEIEISGRHISSLELELNGKLIGELGKDDRRVRKVIITKEGLSVTK
ncbi:MAG: helix-turn-helix domain-containing protein [Candidatus Zapsychrus exili]|nr:helix-turn-helix domain-containing protein [Candidatus Zapsychrus exili]